MLELRRDKRFFALLIRLLRVYFLISLLFIKTTIADKTTNSNWSPSDISKTQSNTRNIPPAPFHEGNRMLPANSFSKRQLKKSTIGNTQPPLFWSYYSNAARTVEKVSTEQGLDPLTFPILIYTDFSLLCIIRGV